MTKCTPICRSDPGFTDACRANNSTRACWLGVWEDPATEQANRMSRPATCRICVMAVTTTVYWQKIPPETTAFIKH